MHAPRQPKPASGTALAASPDAARSTESTRFNGSATSLTPHHPLDNPSIPLFPRAAARRDARDLADAPGQALDGATQDYFSSRFGHDFSSVRVHSDERAAKSAESLAAHAYTLGPHVVFGRGQFAPNTARGRHLLGHELAHVVQQSRGSSAMPDAGNRRLEDDADHAADLAAHGQPVTVAGSSAVGIACKSIFDEFNKGVYAPGLLLQSLEHTRAVDKIVDDIKSLGPADRAQALKDIQAERATREARHTDLTAKRIKQTDPKLQAVLDPEIQEIGRVLSRIDSVLGMLNLAKPIPGWNFTPGNFQDLKNAKKQFTFAPDSAWLPAPLQENLKKTLEFLLDPGRGPSGTEGVNAVDFFHGHLAIKRDPVATPEANKSEAEGLSAEKDLVTAREKEFGRVTFDRNPIRTPAAIARYDKVLAGVAPTFARVMADAAKLPGAAMMYHTFEFNQPSDSRQQGKPITTDDPRRHYVTPLDTNVPRQYTPPKSPANYEKEYTAILRFVFQIDPQGVIHARPFEGSSGMTTLEISTITGQSYPDLLKFEE